MKVETWENEHLLFRRNQNAIDKEKDGSYSARREHETKKKNLESKMSFSVRNMPGGFFEKATAAHKFGKKIPSLKFSVT